MKLKLCSIGYEIPDILHKWKYNKDKNKRKCLYCKREQLQLYMYGEFFWETQNKDKIDKIVIDLPQH